MRHFVMMSIIGLLTLFCMQARATNGTIRGVLVEKKTGLPLGYVPITITNQSDSTHVVRYLTNHAGLFEAKKLSMGQYIVRYHQMGMTDLQMQVVLDEHHPVVELGKIYLMESEKSLGQVEVIGRKSTFTNSIDRKTFNVGQDLMSKAGSVSDLMMNIPSVQVDVDGNVSLRGSENVTILVDGKPSAMMKINRAAALQQMSASTVEKIEIITNPSAKYKPDGTSGIINIVLKRDKNQGFNGNVTANVGNENRRNANLNVNYNPGKLNVFGTLGFRQEDRTRINNTHTTTFDQTHAEEGYLVATGSGLARSVSYTGNLGFDYKVNDLNSVGAAINFNNRSQTKHDKTTHSLQDSTLQYSYKYDRMLFLPETESDLEITAFYLHKFDKKGHELNLNLNSSFTHEKEDNHYTNSYTLPVEAYRYDNTLYKRSNRSQQLELQYTRPFSETSKLEAGYQFEHYNNDMNLNRDTFIVSTNLWSKDYTRSNHFQHSEGTQVAYATYEQEIGQFAFLAGLRCEYTQSKSYLITMDSTLLNRYFRLYPTLHLTYKLSDRHEFQLNYSHRIRRPDDEDLNPFPEYQDLNNIRAGNPNLKPEDTHSFELGYQWRKLSTTFLSTLYYRSKYNSMTSVTKKLDSSTFLTTLENLSKSQAAGLELIFATDLGKIGNLNIASNTFYNSIDASSLGFSNHKAILAWTANANLSIHLSSSTIWQLTSTYSPETLTPQGKRLSTFVMNSGLKQELFNKKASVVVTVSDILNSNKSTYIVDTPDMYRWDERKRSSRIIYLGFIYSFGSSQKKDKEHVIKYDNQL